MTEKLRVSGRYDWKAGRARRSGGGHRSGSYHSQGFCHALNSLEMRYGRCVRATTKCILVFQCLEGDFSTARALSHSFNRPISHVWSTSYVRGLDSSREVDRVKARTARLHKPLNDRKERYSRMLYTYNSKRR